VIAVLALLALGQRAVLDRWRESIELDLPAEVVAEAAPLVSPGGSLAEDGEAIGLAARALESTGEERRAASLLAEAKATEASRGFVETARARLAIGRDEIGEAKRILLADPGADAPVRYPAIPECWLLAGRALARGGEGARAAPLLERFLALAPLDAEAPPAWFMLAQAAADGGQLERAAELRRKAIASSEWQGYYRARRIQIRESPGEPLPRLGLAELFLAAGEFARAEAAARELTSRSPEFCRGFEALGRAQRGLRDPAAARKALERAVECDTELARAWLELARVLGSLGEPDAAAARYARYRELGGTESLEDRQGPLEDR
jgi:tetratricopeptide (TPR) repeat protein